VKELSKGAEKLGVWKGGKALFKWCKKVGGLERGLAPFLWFGRVDQRVRQDFISRLLKAGKVRFLPYPL